MKYNNIRNVLLLGVLVACAIVTVAVRAEDSTAPTEEDGVVVLTDANFKEYLAKTPLALVEFYAPWCGHCKNLAPNYAAAAQTLKEDGIPLVKVDATVETKSANAHGVNGFPTLKVFRNGEAVEYSGGRDTAEIVKFMRDENRPAATEITTVAEYNKAKNADTSKGPHLIGMFIAQSDKSIYLRIARKYLKQGVTFYFTESAEVMEAAGYFSDRSGIFIFPYQGKGKKVMFRGPVSEMRLDDFILGNGLPMVSVMTRDSEALFQAVRDSRNSLVMNVYYKGETAPLDAVKAATKGWSHKNGILRVALVDATEFSSDAAAFGFSDADYATHRAAVFLQGGQKFSLPSGMELKDFHDAVTSGKVEAHIKSEPVPEAAEAGEVAVVVGANFERIVQDSTKAVLIEFYAPWCGHCKALAPKYDELAKKFEGNDKVVIAKMDATANDIPKKLSSRFDVTGFPTIYFAPAGGKKNSVVQYDGAREVDAMYKWVEERL
eukprot:PhM_4_TR5331/c0_g1_i1/m.46227/K09582/PDIA4, ERP72; protein disulfide-isomerase A4